ncbi:MlaD family protein [Actinomadura flavalba]|uniref:MlaD family protein n=1 Tax=Actinomadura flavalba TaxID=1120938 RepID=UPI0003629DD4|nr:MCE family protein [Actinomadura flavalba]
MSDESLSARSRLTFGLAGIGVIAAAATLVALGSTPSHGGSTYYDATFPRAGQGLDPGKSDVKIRGITVGTVDGVRLNRDGRVAVRLRLDEGVRLARTTSATVEPVSVFGPKDIALDLGTGETSGPYLPDGATITRTKGPEDLSDTAWPAYRLTRAINPDEVATLLHTFASGLNGKGPALNRTFRNLSTVVDGTHANRGVLRGLLNDVTGVSGTLAAHGDAFNRTVSDFNRLAPVVYERPDKVSQLLDEGSRLAGTVGGTLNRRGEDIGSLIDGAGGAVAVLAGERRNIPVLIDGLNGFFNLLAAIIRTPGPQGTQLAQALNTLPLDICKTLIDLCGPIPENPRGKANP